MLPHPGSEVLAHAHVREFAIAVKETVHARRGGNVRQGIGWQVGWPPAGASPSTGFGLHVRGVVAPQDREQFRGGGGVAPGAVVGFVVDAEEFEKYLHKKYTGTKRFGVDGGEAMIPAIEQILKRGSQLGLGEIVVGMAHRGRLNILHNVFGKPFRAIISEFLGNPANPENAGGSGDVKYHMGASSDREFDGKTVHLSLAPNPSHLEIVDPVVVGRVRAKQEQRGDADRTEVVGILLHGDAAFAGQGIVAECLAMSDTGGYRIGGTIHLIINNQIGFTTAPQYARSSLYCSDVAKTIQAPIFHVNGDDPEACVRVAQLAWEYRQRFHKDVVIDMVCYRRHGHNEGDDPSYTQPLMYKAIADHRSVRKLYVESLVKRGDIGVDEAEQALTDFQSKLQEALDETRAKGQAEFKAPKPPKPLGVLPKVPTGVDRGVLDTTGRNTQPLPLLPCSTDAVPQLIVRVYS